MGKQVEVLKHHADLAADLLDVLEIAGELGALDDELAALMLLEAVDATDQGRLTGAGGPAYDDALAFVYGQVDVLQHVKLAEPLVDVDHLDHDLLADGHSIRARLNSFIRHCLAPRKPRLRDDFTPRVRLCDALSHLHVNARCAACAPDAGCSATCRSRKSRSRRP